MIKRFMQPMWVKAFKGMLMLLLLAVQLQAQPPFSIKTLKYEGATKQERTQYRKDLQHHIRLATTTAADSLHWAQWSVSLWAMELLMDTSRETVRSLESPLNNYFKLNKSFKRQLLETVYTVAPQQYARRIFEIGMTDTVLKHVLMCRSYLKRIWKDSLPEFMTLEQRVFSFPSSDKNPDLLLSAMMDDEVRKSAISPGKNKKVFAELLTKDFLPNTTIIYSFQRANRNFEGLVIIRKPDGTFLKDKTGKLFSVPQLARSTNGLPWYLTNGNTPQGIFSIQGIDTSESELIGQTPNIQLVMPFETSPAVFFHDSTITDPWNVSMIRKVFPNSPSFNFLAESYYAGKVGRTEIIAHGTTVDPSYYSKRSFYPNTPTQGCLCCFESYSDVNGKCTRSNQLNLVNAFLSTKVKTGYLIVIDIDDKKGAVTLKDVLPFLPVKN